MNTRFYKVKQKMQYVVAALMLLMGVLCYAQSFTEDIQKVAETFKTAHFSVDVTYELFAQHTGNQKIQSMNGTYYVWENLLAYKMGSDIAVYNNERFVLSIDHEAKNMVLNKSNPAFDKKLAKELMKFNVDSIMLKTADVKMLGEKDGIRTWLISYKRPISGIGAVEISIGLSESRLSSIVLYYESTFDDIYNMAPDKVKKSDKPRLVIRYGSYVQLNKEDKEEYFYAKKILTVDKKGKAILTEPFRKYHLANYYNQK